MHLFLLYASLLFAVCTSWRPRSCSPSVRRRSVVVAGGLNPWEFHQIPGVSFKQAVARFDHENAKDPTLENGVAKELLYHQRLHATVLRLNPDASEALQLAARSQHITRWRIPRHSYPMTKPGYLAWRANLKQYHAKTAAAILLEVGYDPSTITAVQDLILKKHPADPNAQTLEDALCLVFLEHQLDEFAAKTEDAKTVNALKKSWGKMSEAGRAAALKIAFSERGGQLVGQALAP